jgi:hypothetical protein
MRAYIFSIASLAACGSSTKPMPDAPKDIGFNKPMAALRANMSNADVGAADLSCLGTASADQATTVAVSLATVVEDFQNKTLNGAASDPVTVTVFKDVMITAPFDTQMSSSSMCPNNAPCGNVTVTIPVGTKRFGFKMVDPASSPAFLPTFLLNQTVAPDTATQTLDRIQTVSNSTATLLPALIGEQRTAGTGVLAGALRDCQKHEVSNFVATVSSTSGTATPIPGAETYYFQAGVDLPVHHCLPGKACTTNEANASSADGLFMAIQLPPSSSAFVQMWGYPTDAEVGGEMTLISELPVPVIADNVITGSYEPLRQ